MENAIPLKIRILFFSLVDLKLQNLKLNYYYCIFNFFNKKFCGNLFSLLLHKRPHNILYFASWPMKPKIFILCPFTETAC